MSLVNGTNVIGYFYENGQWYPAVCGRSISMQVTRQMIETSVSGSGVWATSTPAKISWSGTMEGLMALSVAGSLTIADIESRMRTGTQMLFRFQATAQDGSVYTDQGYCYFNAASKVGSFDNVATWNVDFTGNGALTQVFTPIVQPIPIMYRYEYTASGGETGFTNAALAGKNIIDVNKDGIANAKIVAGAPASKEVQYVTGTGQFVWAITFEAGEIAVVLYQNL